MKRYLNPIKRATMAVAIVAGLSAGSPVFADTTLLTFDSPPGLITDPPYVNWSSATFDFGPTSFDVTVPGGGFGGRYVNIDPDVDATGSIAVEVTVNVTNTGSSAVILVLGDADGTEQGYQWYGLSTGPHVLAKSLNAYGFVSSAGSTPGLDLAHIAYVHLQ